MQQLQWVVALAERVVAVEEKNGRSQIVLKQGSIGGVGGGKKIGEQCGTLVELGGGSDEFGGVEDCVEGVGLGLGVGGEEEEEEEEEEQGSCWVGGQHGH